MAHTGRFKIEHGDLFSHGAYLVSRGGTGAGLRQVPPGRAGAGGRQGVRPAGAGRRCVLDGDPDARKEVKTVTVKITAEHQPVPPEAPAGMPFRPVEFEGLTVTPYVDDKRGRVAYSYRATGMRAPQAGAARMPPRRTVGPTPGEAA